MLTTAYYHSPLGWMQLQCDETHLYELIFIKSEVADNLTTKNDMQTSGPLIQECKKQLDEYFDRKRTKFNLPIQVQGTAFQEKVWRELQNIPYGQTISYKELANRVGSPKACRAVGNANGKNKICIIIPCHRIIASHNKIGGYAYGTKIKAKLLNLEKAFFNL